MSRNPYQTSTCGRTDAECRSGGQTFKSPYPDGQEPDGYTPPCPCAGETAFVTVSCPCPEDGDRAVGGNLTVQGDLTVGGRLRGAALASWIGPAQTGLVTGAMVYLYIDGMDLPNRYAAKTHAHPLSEIYWGGNMPYEAGTVISSDSTDGQLATAKAVYDYVSGRIPTSTGSITPPSGDGSGPQPTGGSDEIPTVGAVIDYVEETVESAVADGLAAAREVYTFAGDGVKRSFPIQHTLMEKEVLASVLDAGGDKVIVRVVFQAVNNLLVMFAEPPAAEEQFTIILCK